MSENNERPLDENGFSKPAEGTLDDQFITLVINPVVEDGEAPGSPQEHGARRAFLLNQILNTNMADLDDESMELLRRLTPEEGLPLLEEHARRERARRAVQRSRTKRSRHSVVGPHADSPAVGVLEWIAKKLPKRIDTEEIGDALEHLQRLVAEGRPRRVIYRKVMRTTWAVLRHTLRHGAEQFLGLVMKFATGQGDDSR